MTVKGLLIKNWYSMRNGIKTIILIMMILLFFSGCIIASISSGNLHKYFGTSIQSFSGNIKSIIYIISVLPLLCSLDIITFHSKDKLCNWNKMLYSTPAKPWQKMMADYLTTYITLIAGLTTGFIICPLIFVFSDLSFHISSYSILLKVFFIMAALMAIILPFYNAFDEAGGAGCLICLFLLLSAIVFMSQDNTGTLTSFGLKMKKYFLNNKYTIPILISIILMMCTSYFISVQIEKRRRYQVC